MTPKGLHIVCDFILIIPFLGIFLSIFFFTNDLSKEMQIVTSLFSAWKKKPIDSLQESFGKTCESIGMSDMFSYEWPGSLPGCHCDKLAIALRAGRCLDKEFEMGCKDVEEIKAYRARKWKTRFLCTTSTKSKGYFESNKVKQFENCPYKYKKCGIIDSLDHHLCVPLNEICPLNAITFLNSVDQANVRIDTSNAKIENGKIFSQFLVAEEELCVNHAERVYSEADYILTNATGRYLNGCGITINYNHNTNSNRENENYIQNSNTNSNSNRDNERKNHNSDTNSNRDNEKNNQNSNTDSNRENENNSNNNKINPYVNLNSENDLNFVKLDTYSKQMFYEHNKIFPFVLDKLPNYPKDLKSNVTLYGATYPGWKRECDKKEFNSFRNGNYTKEINEIVAATQDYNPHLIVAASSLVFVYLILIVVVKYNRILLNNGKIEVTSSTTVLLVVCYGLVLVLNLFMFYVSDVNLDVLKTSKLSSDFFEFLTTHQCSDDYTNAVLKHVTRDYFSYANRYFNIKVISTLAIVTSTSLIFISLFVKSAEAKNRKRGYYKGE